MKLIWPLSVVTLALAAAAPLLSTSATASPPPPPFEWTVVAWNDLGMHCMDSDYEVFSILPPFNNLVAHVIDQDGDLVELPQGVTVTYRAVADPSGSINTSSIGKTNFWDHMQDFFGVSLPPDHGLAGNNMPGAANLPQPMTFDAAHDWFIAEGIPLTPIDDAGHSQSYPMMRVEVRDNIGTLLTSTDVVLPVSEEMDCRACHSSGAGPEAMPAGGWANDPDFQYDFRVNILRLHDELQVGNPVYAAALAAQGFNPAGLEATVETDGRAILCASCHSSNALPGTGEAGVTPLTQAMHAGHADVTDPISGMNMDSIDNRSSCYRCHPGSETRCLRGAMGSAVASDGSMSMQCQSCHGNMTKVGDANRAGWFDEPSCQDCHTGSATHNNGQIRYETVYEPNGDERVAVNALFATNANTPAPGIDLYRFSSGHGGLQCSACHGSTHAIFPSAHGNDNLQSEALQGHAGTLSDCLACHDQMPDTVTGGPHGMHPIDTNWVVEHHDAVDDDNTSQCAVCHGNDYRGTVLSRAQGDRVFNTTFGQKVFWEGYTVGCYDCHNGPNHSSSNNNTPPVAQDANETTNAGVPVQITLVATDAGGTPTVRIVEQPHNGTVSLVGNLATYFPYTGFAGYDSFTFAAADGKEESPLATVSIDVHANWENFGDGVAGTNGVPEFNALARPVLGTAVPIRIGNSVGSQTPAFVLSGTRADYQPTPFGGVFLVADPGRRVLNLPPDGFTRGLNVVNSLDAIGTNIVLQLVVRDPGAPNGFAFSRGLRLTIGE
jgi:Big-like domain-containing protein